MLYIVPGDVPGGYKPSESDIIDQENSKTSKKHPFHEKSMHFIGFPCQNLL